MGMAVGSRNDGPVSNPNIVPLIDVLLVLIIIFMVITPKVPTGLPTLMPQALPHPTVPEQPDPYAVVVQVLPGGKLMINREPSDWNSIGARLSDIFKDRANKVVFLKGAEDVQFEQVARAIDIIRGAGIDHVGLITPATMPEE